MLADFYIPRLSNDMNIAVQKNHLEGQILYKSLVPSKKGVNINIPFGIGKLAEKLLPTQKSGIDPACNSLIDMIRCDFCKKSSANGVSILMVTSSSTIKVGSSFEAVEKVREISLLPKTQRLFLFERKIK